MLLEIGEGRRAVKSSGKIKLPPDFFNLVTSVAELVDAIYPDAVYAISQTFKNLRSLRLRAILVTKSEVVHELNLQIVSMLPGLHNEYKSTDTDDNKAVNFLSEFLNSLVKYKFISVAAVPPHGLLLKVILFYSSYFITKPRPIKTLQR